MGYYPSKGNWTCCDFGKLYRNWINKGRGKHMPLPLPSWDVDFHFPILVKSSHAPAEDICFAFIFHSVENPVLSWAPLLIYITSSFFLFYFKINFLLYTWNSIVDNFCLFVLFGCHTCFPIALSLALVFRNQYNYAWGPYRVQEINLES